jgi:radical SAM superfamily enzyme YgiQ (UPF0313 family)
MYKGSTFEARSVTEVKDDIIAAKGLAEEIKREACATGDRVSVVARGKDILWLDDGDVTSAFIGDSDSLVIGTEDFAEMLRFLCQSFPSLEKVASYTRAKTLAEKSLDELKMLRQVGLTDLHVGLESGDDELLQYVDKGVTAAELMIGGQKAVAAGLELSEYVILGFGGRGRWEQHIRETARVLNEINPHSIRLRTLGISPGVPLYEKQQWGEFILPSLEDLVIEARTLIENLEVSSQLVASDYSGNLYLLGVDGKLPEGKNRMLRTLGVAIDMAR